MRTKHARLIRIGINYKRIPYITKSDEHGSWTVVDMMRLFEARWAYDDNQHVALVRAAADRTKRWTSVGRAQSSNC